MSKKPSPFDYWKAIQTRKYPEDISGYVDYIFTMLLSSDPDFVHLANNMNKIGTHVLPPRALFDYYYYTIPKNSLFLRYPKKKKDEQAIKYLQEYFEIDENVAKQYMTMLDEKQIDIIVKRYEDHGVK